MRFCADCSLCAKNHPQTILAASTHPGEDEIILDAFHAVHQSAKNLKLIIAPRHVKRAKDVKALAKTRGLNTTFLDSTNSNANVYIVNQLGTLPSLYNLAAITIVGGSLVPDIGGHTPYEPAYAKSAIISGPHVNNFSNEYETLKAMNGAIITPKDELTTSIRHAMETSETLSKNAYLALASKSDPHQLFEDIAHCMGVKA